LNPAGVIPEGLSASQAANSAARAQALGMGGKVAKKLGDGLMASVMAFLA
jgi:hypothetical protein